MLTGYEFGFILFHDGLYRSCVKEPAKPSRWFGLIKTPRKQWTYHTKFMEHIGGRYRYHAGEIYFNSVKVPDCSKFACHTVTCCKDDLTNYFGYSQYLQADESYYVRKWFSVEEYKEFVVKAVGDSLERNKELIANEKLFREKGSVFVRCK